MVRSDRRRRRSRVAVALLALVTGAALLVAGFSSRPSTPLDLGKLRAETSHGSVPSPVRKTPRRSAKSPGLRDMVVGPVLPTAVPTRISIPRIHVSSPLESLGIRDDGQMEVPADPARAGWYANGPSPGALGPAVIAGHVTWNGEAAVFVDIARLRPGDQVRVDRADHRNAVFVVTRVAQYAKSRFPTRLVYGSIDHAGLRLITCGGEYDDSAHRYADNVVVFARLVGR